MKLGFVSGQRGKWQLKRVLKRDPKFRPIEDEDVKFLWAAYKKGSLAAMEFEDGLSAEEFRSEFEITVLESFDAAWTLIADTRKGRMPVGCIFAHWGSKGAHWMIVDGLVWFPWASIRNRVESAVSFFRTIHHEIPMIGCAKGDDKKIYEVCLVTGIMRRTGTTYNVFDEPAAIYETRTLQ